LSDELVDVHTTSTRSSADVHDRPLPARDRRSRPRVRLLLPRGQQQHPKDLSDRRMNLHPQACVRCEPRQDRAHLTRRRVVRRSSRAAAAVSRTSAAASRIAAAANRPRRHLAVAWPPDHEGHGSDREPWGPAVDEVAITGQLILSSRSLVVVSRSLVAGNGAVSRTNGWRPVLCARSQRVHRTASHAARPTKRDLV